MSATNFQVFSAGAAGAAHVMAHDLLDRGQARLGYRLLSRWLSTHPGAGSQWVHLQWHLAVFALADNKWNEALDIFQEHVLPAALGGEAPTDAPSLLWRLALAAPSTRPSANSPLAQDLPWQTIRASALLQIEHENDPFVALHHLLSLAGARDTDSVERWLQSHTADCAATRVVHLMGVALKAFATDNFLGAAAVLAAALPGLSRLSGSRAQHDLFRQIAAESLRLAGAGEPDSCPEAGYAKAA